MNARLKVGLIAGSVVVAFACGWLLAKVQDVNKVAPETIWTNHWVDDITMLVTNGRNTQLLTAAQTQALVVSGLELDSHTMAEIYDRLPKDMQARMLFWVPAARQLAAAYSGEATPAHRNNLKALVDCMQSVQAHGGSVRQCMVKAHVLKAH
ncbi:MAG TPA: hypothetical protein VF264_03605 [Rhodanobacteraceae bacterium]